MPGCIKTCFGTGVMRLQSRCRIAREICWIRGGAGVSSVAEDDFCRPSTLNLLFACQIKRFFVCVKSNCCGSMSVWSMRFGWITFIVD